MATKNQLNVDPVLSNVSIQYKNSEMSYISEKFAPVVPVDNDTGIYYEYDRSAMRADNDTRGPGASANVVDFDLSQKTYGPIVDHALKTRITDEDRETGGKNGVDLESDAVEMLTNKILINKEKDLLTKISNTSVITNYEALSGTDKWNDYGNSSPLKDIREWRDSIKALVGLIPNTLTLSYDVLSTLQDHPEFLERAKYTQLGLVDLELIKKLTGIQNILVADAQENTANEGQTASVSYIFSKKLWLSYTTAKPAKKTVSGIYTLRHDIGGFARQVEKWRDPEKDKKQDWISTSYRYEHKVMAAGAIFYGYNIID